MQFSVSKAKSLLHKLIKAVEHGESVTISRRGVPVVDIVPTRQDSQKTRTLGTLHGKIQIHDQDWWKPLSKEAVSRLFGGELD